MDEKKVYPSKSGKWLFHAIFNDGTRIDQTLEDYDQGGDLYKEVEKRKADLIGFCVHLHGTNEMVGLDLRDGKYCVNDKWEDADPSIDKTKPIDLVFEAKPKANSTAKEFVIGFATDNKLDTREIK